MLERNFWNPEQLSEMPPGNGVIYGANPGLPGDHAPPRHSPRPPTASALPRQLSSRHVAFFKWLFVSTLPNNKLVTKIGNGTPAGRRGLRSFPGGTEGWARHPGPPHMTDPDGGFAGVLRVQTRLKNHHACRQKNPPGRAGRSEEGPGPARVGPGGPGAAGRASASPCPPPPSPAASTLRRKAGVSLGSQRTHTRRERNGVQRASQADGWGLCVTSPVHPQPSLRPIAAELKGSVALGRETLSEGAAPTGGWLRGIGGPAHRHVASDSPHHERSR